jgi:integrase
VHLDTATLTVRRLKGSKDSTQPLQGDVLRALRRLYREAPAGSAFVFLSERGAPFTTDGFRKMLKRAATAAGLAHLNVNPHGLRARHRALSGGARHRHPHHSGLPRAPGHPADGAVHRGQQRQVSGVVGQVGATS